MREKRVFRYLLVAGILAAVLLFPDQQTVRAARLGSIYVRWLPLESPTTATLRGVAAYVGESTPISVWMVGDEGTILRYEDEGFTRVSSPTTGTLRAVAFESYDHAWAVGDRGTVLEFSEGIWRALSKPFTTLDLTGVAVVPHGVYVTAGSKSPGEHSGSWLGEIWYRRPDGDWRCEVQTDEAPLLAIDASPTGDLVAAVGGPTDPDLNGWVAYTRADDSWTMASNLAPGVFGLNAVSVWSASDAWAVGEYGLVQRYEEGRWAQMQGAPKEDLYSVDTVGPGYVWVVGADGLVAKSKNGSWEVQWARPEYADTLFGVSFPRPGFSAVGDRGFAVGVNGRVRWYHVSLGGNLYFPALRRHHWDP